MRLLVVVHEDAYRALQDDEELVAKVTLIHHVLPFLHLLDPAVLQYLVKKGLRQFALSLISALCHQLVEYAQLFEVWYNLLKLLLCAQGLWLLEHSTHLHYLWVLHYTSITRSLDGAHHVLIAAVGAVLCHYSEAGLVDIHL